MPPAGFVGLKLTPQRKLMLSEVMQSENLNKPSEAIDLVLALAADYVKPDESELTELPNFLNYYVGEAAPEELTPNGTVAPLVKQERRNQMVSNLSWRKDALSYVKNIEPTIVNLADAIDFALSAYIMASRSGSVTEERLTEVREQVKRNAVLFREEVEDFLAENMADQEKQARLAGTKTKRNKKPSVATTEAYSQLALMNGRLVTLYRKYVTDKGANTKDKQITLDAILRLEQEMRDIDRALAMGNVADAVKNAEHESVAVKTDSEGNRSALPF